MKHVEKVNSLESLDKDTLRMRIMQSVNEQLGLIFDKPEVQELTVSLHLVVSGQDNSGTVVGINYIDSTGNAQSIYESETTEEAMHMRQDTIDYFDDISETIDNLWFHSQKLLNKVDDS